MSGCYSVIHIHVVFAVQNRDSLISDAWKNELYKYITGIIQNKGNKLLSIGGMPDHIHILLGLRPEQKLSDLVRDIKCYSTRWIREKQFIRGRFEWQKGYGAFSYSESHLSKVIKYIESQEIHHKKKSLQEEHIFILKSLNVQFDERYIFHSID